MSSAVEREFNSRSLGAAATCGTATLLGPGSALSFTQGFLLTAAAHEFGWSRTTSSAVPTLTSREAPLSSCILGRWISCHGARKVPIPAVAGFVRSSFGSALAPSVAWMFFAAYLPERATGPRFALLYLTAGVVGILLLHNTPNATAPLASAILIGLGLGAELSVIVFISSRTLGLRAFGLLNDLIHTRARASAAVGLLAIGVLFDFSGSNDFALTLFEALLIAALALIMFVGPFKYGKAGG